MSTTSSTITSTGIKKLEEEYKKIRRNPVFAQIQGGAAPIKKKENGKIKRDFLHWSGSIIGPKDTPYANGLYYFEMKFTDNYPKKGPIDVQMRTKIYHPNIDSSNGHICVSYFSGWEETNDVIGIVNAIFDLLEDPNPKSSYNSLDKKKAEEFNSKYATLDQEYNWNESWGKGWDNTI